jgi:hypothetical protein
MNHQPYIRLFRMLLGIVILAAEGPGIAFEQDSTDVASFVRGSFYHGVPYVTAHAFDPQAVPVLLAMLEREEERPHWANIVSVLGMIGDARATKPMIHFLEQRFSGPVDLQTWQALLQVNQSLGFLARDPRSFAFRYLREGTSLDTWRRRNLRWTYESHTVDRTHPT